MKNMKITKNLKNMKIMKNMKNMKIMKEKALSPAPQCPLSSSSFLYISIYAPKHESIASAEIGLIQ